MYPAISIYKTIRLTLALALSMTLTACLQQENQINKETKKTEKRINYPTASVQFINPEYEISIPAELRPYEQVAVFAKVSGFVKKLYVDRGDHVRKGQLLAVLEAPEMNQRYLSDKATEQKIYSDYLFARQAYDRLKDASTTSGAIAAIELERAKSNVESARAAFESSRAGASHTSQLQQYLRITAPFDGVITERSVSIGALAGSSSNQSLFTIAQGNKLRLTLSIPEKHAASVQQGVRANFAVSSQPGKIFKTTLSRTSGLLDQHDRSLTLEFDVDNTSGELQGGDYAQVKLMLKRNKPSTWVPKKSILTNQSGTFIFILDNQEIKRIPIKEGVYLDTLTEIFGQVSAGSQIILKPSEEIKEGKISK